VEIQVLGDNPNPEVAELVAGFQAVVASRQESTKWTVGKEVSEKKKNDVEDLCLSSSPLEVVFFCHAFLTPPFKARKKHLRFL